MLINIAKLQEYTGSQETDLYPLWNLAVAKAGGVEEVPPVVDIDLTGEESPKRGPGRPKKESV